LAAGFAALYLPNSKVNRRSLVRMDTVARYRERAAYFRRLAEADSPLREQFEALARQYDQLADSLEGITSKNLPA
jgi:hypothetical protein